MQRGSLKWCLLGLVAGVGLTGVLARGQEPAPPVGFEALLGFDQLPWLVHWPAFQDSSYDRKNLNQDAGNFLRVEPNGDQVLMDTDGPGVIYRLWSTGVVGTQMSPQCRLQFFFDGEARPRLDLSMSELFGSKGSRWPFVPPLSVTFESGVGGGEGPANLCYVPIPFSRHLKIVGRKVMYYHVDYHKLPSTAALESFSYELAEKHRGVLEKAAALWQEVGQRPGLRKEQKVQEWNNVVLAPHQEWRSRLVGPGTLGTLGVQLTNPTPRALRGLALEISFEDEKQVCVRTPLGDFFGSGCGHRRFQSLPAGMTDSGYYAYWPMPFQKSAVVKIRNDLSEPVTLRGVKIGTIPGTPPGGSGYFHARYVENHDIPLGEDYHILQVNGRGKFVGTNVTMQNARGGTGIFFLEGDEKIYADGEKWPSRWLGTGTEDYFNGAYFWNAPNKAALARPYGGLTFLDWGIGRVCAYRWHITDFISFEKNLRVDLEHGGVNDSPADYQSVAYYYLDRPSSQPSLPPLA